MLPRTTARLYSSIVFIVGLSLIIGPWVIRSYEEDLQHKFISACTSEDLRNFDSCHHLMRSEVLSLWSYLLPYVPALLLIWGSWILSPGVRLSTEDFPRRLFILFEWVGYLSILLAIYLSIDTAMQKDPKYFASVHEAILVYYLSTGPVLANTLFLKLVGPEATLPKLRRMKMTIAVAGAAMILSIGIAVSRVQ